MFNRMRQYYESRPIVATSNHQDHLSCLLMMTQESREKFLEALTIWRGMVLRGAVSFFDLIFVARYFPAPFCDEAWQLIEEQLLTMGYPMCATMN